jgi:MFS family permease
MVADIISTAGTEMTAVALPWFVLVTTGSPTQMGAVLAAEFAGLTLLGLVGGKAATALGPRATMLGSDLVRAALIALIPVLSFLDLLSFPLILVIAFTIGSFFPAYQSSGRLLVAALVSDDELRMTRVGGLMNAVNETASFVGPGLGGVLVVVLGPGPVLLLDAASYGCAFLLVATLVRAVRPAHGDDEPGDTAFLGGLRYLWRHRRLRYLLLGIGVMEIGFTAFVATVPVLALHGTDGSGGGGATVAGWLLGAYGGGSVVGGLISSRARRTGGRTPAVAALCLAACACALLLPVPVWGLGVAIAGIGVSSGLFFPRLFSMLTTTTPPALRARVLTSVTVVISAPGPVGFLGAGVLAQVSGSAFAGLVLVAVTATVGGIIMAGAFPRSEPSTSDGDGAPE